MDGISIAESFIELDWTTWTLNLQQPGLRCQKCWVSDGDGGCVQTCLRLIITILIIIIIIIISINNTDGFIAAARNSRQKEFHRRRFHTRGSYVRQRFGIPESESEYFIHPQGGLLMSQCFCPVRKQHKKWLRTKQEPEAKMSWRRKKLRTGQTNQKWANNGGWWTHENSAEDFLFVHLLFIYLLIDLPARNDDWRCGQRERERDRFALWLSASLWTAEGTNTTNKQKKAQKKRPSTQPRSLRATQPVNHLDKVRHKSSPVMLLFSGIFFLIFNF